MSPTRGLVLVAGPSGSGKSHLARMSGLPVLRLDDFYRDGDDPRLPRSRGIVDWDAIGSWNLEAACAVVVELLHTGRAHTPDYSIAENRTVGLRHLDLGGSPLLLAEGIFAIETAEALTVRGVPTDRIWLDRPAVVNFTRRLRRDLVEHRKPPLVLMRRGVALWQVEATQRRRALAGGFEPMSLPEAHRRIDRVRGPAW
ncbi:MAG: uridine kinase [Propionibacterium sp.]|nr:uridine kinase [Propionibacterium sp.]